MTSSQSRNVWLILFIAMTIIFSLISAFELIEINNLRTELDRLKQPSLVCFNDDTIYVKGAGSFVYVRETTITAGNVVTLRNVTFTLWVNSSITYTMGLCMPYRGYVITFQDGASEDLTACHIISMSPIETRFTKHLNPQAGLLIFPDGTVYLLVSAP
jgi:hypothetical protein